MGNITYQELEELRKEYACAKTDYGRMLILIGRYRIDTGQDIPDTLQKAADIIENYIQKCQQSLYDKQDALDRRTNALKEVLLQNRVYQTSCGEFFDMALHELPKRSKFMMCQFYKICEDFKEQLKSRAEYLKKGTLRILLTGEVNAGKSSVLSLLMGGAYLPFDHGPCTKIPCEVVHSHDKKAYLYFTNDYGIDPTVLDLSHDENHASWLRVREGIVSGRDNEEGFKNLEKVVLHWPLVILASQESMILTEETPTSSQHPELNDDHLPEVTFIDVPGIFDKDETFQTLIPYIRSADAFLFVINNTDHIGLADDRVLRLMRMVQRLFEEGQGSFHPKCSLFVCNFWDRVEDHRRESLLTTTATDLKKVWPAVIRKQLIPCVASVESLHAVKARSISDEYEGFYHKVCRFLETAIKSQIEMNSWWLASLLDRSTVIMRNTRDVRYYARQKSAEVKRQITDYQRQILNFERSRKQTEQDIFIQTELVKNSIQAEIGKSLKENKPNLMKWNVDTLPETRPDSRWTDTFNDISTKITDRLEEHIINDPKLVQIRSDFDNYLRKCLSNLIVRFMKLEKRMPLIVDITSGLDTKIHGLNSAIQRNRDIFPLIAAGLAVLFLPLTPFILLLMQVYNEINAPRYLTDDNEYNKDPIAFMAKQTECFIDNIIESRLVTVTEATIQDAPRNARFMITYLHNCTERYLESTRDLMDEVSSSRNVMDSSKEIEDISEHLKLFVINNILENDLDENSLIVDTMDRVKLIGRGSFSTVHRAELLTDEESLPVAVKQVKWPRGEGKAPENSFVIRELLTLQMLSHKPLEERMNFIEYHGFLMTTTEHEFRLQLVTDLYDFNLEHLIAEDNLVLPSPANSRRSCVFPCKDDEYGKSCSYVLHIALQVAKGVQFLHRYNIVHRDIKPSNFLIRFTDESITVHLADFGMSQQVHLVKTFGPRVGTELYLSPEVRNGHLNRPASDVYSTGLVLWELWYGRQVYSNVPVAQLASRDRPLPKITKRYPPEVLKNILIDCWKQVPEQRPSISKIVKDLSGLYEAINSESEGGFKV